MNAKWSREEEERALSMRAAGIPYLKIAAALGRPINGVKQRLQTVTPRRDEKGSIAALRRANDRLVARLRKYHPEEEIRNWRHG